MNEHDRRRFEREGRIAKAVIVLALLVLVPFLAYWVLFFFTVPYTSPFPDGSVGGIAAPLPDPPF